MISDSQRNALVVIENAYPALWDQHAHGLTASDVRTGPEASRIIGAICNSDKQLRSGMWPWTYWTKQTVCAQALYETGGTTDAHVNIAVQALAPKLGKIKALTFGRNVNGRRVPFNISDPSEKALALEALRKQMHAIKGDVHRAIVKYGGEKQQQREDGGGEQQEQKKEDTKARRVFDRILAVQAWCKERAADGHEIDEIGLRPFEYAAKMLRAGIPEDAIFHALTMHYPPEARKSLAVKDFDVTKFRAKEQEKGKHAALPYILSLISERIPVALVGPKGTGKTTLAGHVAKKLDLPFGMVSMTSATPPSAFNGRPRIASDGTEALVAALIGAGKSTDALMLAMKGKEQGDTISSQFEKIYSGGGVFLFDEMDASDENLLLLVNAALANGQFANAATGEIVERHPDFIPMAGMNTLGLGSGRHYNGRSRLDAATLDRWNMGRVKIDFDVNIAESMFAGIVGEEF